MLERYVAFDCETSGLDPQSSEILQLAAVRFQDGRPADDWCRMVRPRGAVPPAVLRLTGLDPEALAQAEPLEAVLPPFAAFVRGLPRVAHNAPFDEGFLAAGLRRCGLPPLDAPVVDTHELVRLVAPLLPSRRLGDLAVRWGISLDRAHDALADALAAGHLFARLGEELARLPAELIGVLEHLLRPAGGTLYDLVRQVRGGPDGRPAIVLRSAAAGAGTEADAEAGARARAGAQVRAEWGSESQPGTGVSRGEPHEGGGRQWSGGAFTAADLAALLAPGSDLAGALPSFEPRAGQVRMLQAVCRAFEEGRHLLAEAGTGTGKSLAYLIPALAWAHATGERVVVATHTLNLQDQLVERDIPLASRSLPGRAALLKGRSQYVCLKSWEEQLARPPDAVAAGFHARVASWLAVTATGDREELGFLGDDDERWQALSSEGVACTGRRCTWYDRCFLFGARRRADQADVVVANHALLLADLRTGGQVLPEHACVVVDEAHHLDSEASAHLGVQIGERRLLLYLTGVAQRLEAWRRAHEPLDLAAGGGLLGGAGTAGGSGGSGGDDSPLAAVRAAEVARRAAHEEVTAFFGALRPWAERRSPATHGRLTTRFGRGVRAAAAGSGREADGEPPAEGRADAEWEAVAALGRSVAQRMRRLAEALQGVEGVVGDGSGASPYGTIPPDRDGAGAAVPPSPAGPEFEALAAQAGEFADAWHLLSGEPEGWVTWVEMAARRGAAGAAVLYGAPVDPAPLLAERLFGPRRSVVLTSATLTVGESFRFAAERLGLDGQPAAEPRYDTLAVESPFDYSRQALLCVPRDLPPVRRADPAAYAAAVAPFLVQLFRRTRGRALCLFTANRLLRAVHAACRGPLEAEGIVVLAQGLDGSRSRLAAALREPGATVVFGSASFWEGVDVPGEALSCVVLAQLPFWAPDIPLVQARIEALESAGRSSFEVLSLPQAVLRFKQGFGRLIRSGLDRGVAVCLDDRLVTARYGRVFVGSLPGPTLVVGDREKVLGGIGRWLDERPAAGA